MLLVKARGPVEVEAALLAWVRDWLDLLAEGRLEDACARLDEANVYGIRWTPDAIRDLVEDTFGPGTQYRAAHPAGPRFTSVGGARGEATSSVGGYDDGSGFFVEHDVPLNGEFSELTAQFDFRWRGEGALAARLHDLHVL